MFRLIGEHPHTKQEQQETPSLHAVDEINILKLFENHVAIKEKEQAAHQAQFGK